MKNKINDLAKELQRDIAENYHEGDSFYSIREIAEKFQTSPVTAHKAVGILKDLAMVSAAPKKGIQVLSPVPRKKIADKRVLILGLYQDEDFNRAFQKGIMSVFSREKVKSLFHISQEENISSYNYAKYLLDLLIREECDALIALSHRNATLPFFYLQERNYPVLSDVIIDDLPETPGTQTDNKKHAGDAAHFLLDRGKSDILVVGYWDEDNTRFKHFSHEIYKRNPHCRLTYLDLSQRSSNSQLLRFLRTFTRESALFSIDYFAHSVVSGAIIASDLTIRDKGDFIVYDSDEGQYQFGSVRNIPTFGPSLEELGKRLGERMIHRLREGEWDRPFWQFI